MRGEALPCAEKIPVSSLFRRGHYDTMGETVFLFDRNIDCWSDGRYMFIANVGNFERMFRYFEQLQARAQQTVDAVSGLEFFLPISLTTIRLPILYTSMWGGSGVGNVRRI